MRQTNVLIVDDNQDLADGLAMVLEDENYLVSLAYNGHDAIKVFESGHFDIVFIDVKLPDMNGVEVFYQLKQKDQQVNAILMTGYRVEQLLAEVADNGEVELLLKSFDIKRVLEVVEQIKNESIVLIAESDPGFSESLSEYLNDQGTKTMVVKNEEEALETMSSNKVEVLVLDLRMPIICGLEIYLQLKKEGRAVKTIIVTGHAKDEKETVDILKSMSVTGCLFKPFNPEEMLDAVKQAML